MINGECKCMVCGKINKYSINTNIESAESNRYILNRKNDDGTYDTDIFLKCCFCGANYKLKENIAFVPDEILEEEPSVYDFIERT